MNAVGTLAEPRFRFKVIPLLIAAALGVGVPYGAGYLAYFCSRVFHTPSPQGPLLQWLYIQHGFQLALALVVIAGLKYWLVPADVVEYLIVFAWCGAL